MASTSIDLGRDEDSPPLVPPRERDCFLTPQEPESWQGAWPQDLRPQDTRLENTWPQEQQSWAGGEEGTWGASLRSGSPSPAPSPAPRPGAGSPEAAPEFARLGAPAEVGAGSMVQLRTAEGENMFGVVRYVGDAPGAPGRWAGVELEGELKGGHTGLVAGQRLFTCAPGKGVLVPMTHLMPDPRFAESLPPAVQQDFGGLECPAVKGHHPPHSGADPSAIHGRNKGIQGHQNSCYLDATLFSMFCFTSAFDSLLYRPRNKGDVAKYDEVQQVLRDEIVNPLRRSLYVRADRVMKLRELLDSLSDVQGLTDQEKDPEEFLSSLLTQVMKAEPYLELSSGQTAHHYQLFVEKDPDLPLPSVQDLFDQSFNASRVKLRKAPPVLILQMPRFGRQFKVYDRILPSQLLDVTDIIEGAPRQCVICGVLAEVECAQCFGDHDSGLQSTAFCAACLGRTHQHARRANHRTDPLKAPAGWTKQKDQPIPRIFMELVAVVCIETSHYVSFVRCGDSPRAPWCFFDSMADRKGEQNGYNIPELVAAPEVERVLAASAAADLPGGARPKGDQVERLCKDAYMMFYQSPDVRMYR